MSRIPQPSSRGHTLKVDPPSRTTPSRSRTNSSVGSSSPRTPKTPNTPGKPSSSNTLAAPSTRLRTISKPAPSVKATAPNRSPTPGKASTFPRRVATPAKPAVRAPSPLKDASRSTTPQLSIREQIALKRAEAKKAQRSVAASPSDTLEDAVPDAQPVVEEDILGRLSLRETIERARTTGALNIVARSLPCIPSALFEIHLGITPDPLKSVPDEPPLPPAPPKKGTSSPAWFDAQDLQVLKAFNNDIVEIQSEISLFGSLKVLDIHGNKLTELPADICDLMVLSTLDVSHNSLVKLPPDLFSLPELTVLNVSHNALTSLHFNEPFAPGYRPAKRSENDSVIICDIPRSTVPLPRLVTLDASHNKLAAGSVDLPLPSTLIKIDLSSNPVGSDQPCRTLLSAAARLHKLKELHFAQADLGDEVFTDNVFPPGSFPSLQLFDLRETRANLEAVKASLVQLKQELSFDFILEDPPEGVTRVLVGKQVIREAWEIEAEQRRKARTAHLAQPAEPEQQTKWQACSQARDCQGSLGVRGGPGTADGGRTPARPREGSGGEGEGEGEGEEGRRGQTGATWRESRSTRRNTTMIVRRH
ncbi:hypothetical protein BD626DRAFT_121331 [Schizophyllum amplum]|uniref:Leucine-rich repeat-containing protein 40 n=1 Tax=Schizophyllum amplum TaxID=97359 RepID=A0A550C7G3_9AGAR|nr:hypothetical protein BD626DRAFT_121331 [Auriculariopsis ampla]